MIMVMKAFLPDAKGNYNDIAKAPDFGELDGRYYETTSAAVSCGVVLGDESGRLNPKANITRAEACAIIMRAANKKGDLTPYTAPVNEVPAPQTARYGGVSENGSLKVIGTQLCNESREPVVLHGMSSHGLQWFPAFVTENAIKATADRGANLIRLAMYTDEYGGYCSGGNRKALKKLIDYYGSSLWMNDFEDDENGKLPKDLKRGVLSEDSVYDLITKHHEIVLRMTKIISKAIEGQML